MSLSCETAVITETEAPNIWRWGGRPARQVLPVHRRLSSRPVQLRVYVAFGVTRRDVVLGSDLFFGVGRAVRRRVQLVMYGAVNRVSWRCSGRRRPSTSGSGQRRPGERAWPWSATWRRLQRMADRRGLRPLRGLGRHRVPPGRRRLPPRRRTRLSARQRPAMLAVRWPRCASAAWAAPVVARGVEVRKVAAEFGDAQRRRCG